MEVQTWGYIGIMENEMETIIMAYMRLRSAFPPPPWVSPPPLAPDASKVSTVTGMGPLGVAILVTVIVFDA